MLKVTIIKYNLKKTSTYMSYKADNNMLCFIKLEGVRASMGLWVEVSSE